MHKRLRWNAMLMGDGSTARVPKAVAQVRSSAVVEDTSHIGATIRLLRMAADLTQNQLAEQANVSVSLLDQVEGADRAVTPALLAALGRALKVPVERLTGQPYIDDHRDEQVHRDIDALREVLRRYGLPADQPARSLPELTDDVAELDRLHRNADYRKLAARLPGLVEELTVAAHQASPATTETVHGLVTVAYRTAHFLLHHLGYADLAEAVEHKLALAAERSGDPLAQALVHWTRNQTLQQVGDYAHGLRLLDIARAGLEDQLRRPTPAALTVYGSLHLSSAYLAAQSGDATTTRDHLAAARELATRLGGSDQVHYGLTFGPATVITYEVAAHVEAGDAAAALVAAEGYAPPRNMPRLRRGYHYLHLARAHLLHGDGDGCLRALDQARRIAPQQTRLHPLVRDTIAVLISLHRRAQPDLTDYAGWLGIPS
ncbi:MAG: helix-turn-helix domain-containing protein [Pseudonocardiaceae bacterium]